MMLNLLQLSDECAESNSWQVGNTDEPSGYVGGFETPSADMMSVSSECSLEIRDDKLRPSLRNMTACAPADEAVLCWAVALIVLDSGRDARRVRLIARNVDCEAEVVREGLNSLLGTLPLAITLGHLSDDETGRAQG